MIRTVVYIHLPHQSSESESLSEKSSSLGLVSGVRERERVPNLRGCRWSIGALSGGAYVALVVNNLLADRPAGNLSFPVGLLAAAAAGGALPAGASFKARELWQHRDLPGGLLSADSVLVLGAVGAHDCTMLRFDPVVADE